MAKYRSNLPQLGGDVFLTDGGIETTLIYHDGLHLPEFAAFDLLRHESGRNSLDQYFRVYATLAVRHEVGLILESPTWRANTDWGEKLGYSPAALDEANRQAVALLHEIRNEFESSQSPMVISGCIGPRGDGYSPSALMTEDRAQEYHSAQITAFNDADVDMVTAITMNYPAEAVGVAKAATAAGMPVVMSFTVETDGCLPNGETLATAIEQVDEATDYAPAYYMINCAHPTHFEDIFRSPGEWMERIGGLRANASKLSHAELDQAEELDAGDPVKLGSHYREMRRHLQNLTVLGGCCGTDHRHIEQIYLACRD